MTNSSAMKIAVLGGAGAMGSLYGGYLSRAGHDVTLVDVEGEGVDTINARGLEIVEQSGDSVLVAVPATADACTIGPVDLVIVLVKGMHTSAATRGALPLIGEHSAVLTLQNGWGNVARIGDIVGASKVLAGVSIHSVTTLAPGRIQHSGSGPTLVGEVDGTVTPRLERITAALGGAGFDVNTSTSILDVIWSKLSLNCCALPACALLRWRSGQLVEHEPTLQMMRAVLREVVAVARAQGIALDFDERWQAIHAQLVKAPNVRASMLQDVERGRKTEIDTITGAVVAEGRRLGVPTPHNETLYWLIRGLEDTLAPVLASSR